MSAPALPPEPRRTVPVRLPADLAASITTHAAFKGITPGLMIDRAWSEFWKRNGNRIVDEMHATVEAMRP